jgi:enoyl-CoA hydratase/carnithine racemase
VSAHSPDRDRPAPGAPPDEILVTREGPILTVTFNRPHARNALTWRMYERLGEACEAADADASVRVVVLRGAGGAFVAGTDIAQFQAFRSAEDGLAYERMGDRHVRRLEGVAKPVIAQVEGPAVGAGLRVAAACDLRVATPDARFGAPIARTLGNCLSAEAYARLVDLLGPSRTTALLFTARLLTAAEAHAAGFVHELAAPEAIDARVRALAAELAGHAPITLRVTKEAIRRLRASRPAPDLDDLIAETYASADFHEGVRAFLDKRTPQWSGH